jgi:hypothetical protein
MVFNVISKPGGWRYSPRRPRGGMRLGINFVVTKKGTSEHELYIVSGANGWQAAWLPACKELGLQIVPNLSGGTYSHFFPPEDIPQLVRELSLLRPWMNDAGFDLFVSFIDRMLRVFAETDPNEYEYSFG